MSMNHPIDFGDTVRVRDLPETRAKGLAGLTGQVYGLTTPSMTGVEVIGSPSEDFAVNVHFEGRGSSWFAGELLEFVDHAPGTRLRINGTARSWVRTKDGSWTKQNDAPTKRWWQFWK